MPQYTTTQEQREQLLDDGYVLLSGAIPSPLLERWQELAERLHADAMANYERGEPTHRACVIESSAGPQLIRFDDIFAVDHDAVLDLLSCPAMLAVARELCGTGVVPLQLDILYKHCGPDSVIPWHQGAPHPRSYPYLNVGIYLDDAAAGDGCLRYVPGTQHELQDISGLSAAHGWDPPGVVEQPASAGDILVQDMMVLHGSQPKRNPGVRRTIYIELRPIEGIQESAQQSSVWADLRRRWMALTVRRGAEDDWPIDWRDDLPNDLADDATEFAAIAAHHEVPIPAVYAAQAVHAPGYPIPDGVA